MQLAAQIFYVLFSFEVRKEPVEEKELRFCARDGTTYRSQIMQLSEGAGEGRFAALIRTGYYKYSLLIRQVEIITDDG